MWTPATYFLDLDPKSTTYHQCDLQQVANILARNLVVVGFFLNPLNGDSDNIYHIGLWSGINDINHVL
jgi:hypothetical protein